MSEALDALDKAYVGMYEPYRSTHRGAVEEMARLRDTEHLSNRILEIACGTGVNAENFLNLGFDYYGYDIAETAIAVVMTKYPRGKFFNLPISDLSLIRDSAFDLVYNSSRLEHLGEHEQALRDMIRVTGRHLFAMFYEGLLPGAENKIGFHRITAQI